MKQEASDHKLIVRYLLKDLSEQEEAQLEQQYFGDDDFFEQVLVVESEMMDDYVRGEMSGRERERFEARFLASPRLRQRVELARSLVDYATESSVAASPAEQKRKPVIWWQSLLNMPGAKNRGVRLALAVAVLVVAVGSLLFIVETVRLRNQVERIQADRAEMLRREQELQQQLAEQGARNEQLADELQRERSQRELMEQDMPKTQRSNLSAITFILTPDLIRGAGGPKRLIIPQRSELVRMQLDLDQDDYKSYRAVIETVEGKRTWSSGSLKARPNNSGKVVTLGLPASLLTGGDYLLTLSGVKAGGSLENIGEYYLNVIKK